MWRYILRRILQVVLTLYIFVSIVFFLMALQPGDISDIFLSDPTIPPEASEALRQRLGLDQPLHIQYINYLRNLMRGDFGNSFSHFGRTVWDLIKERLPRTVALFFVAALVYFALAFQIGKLIAWRRGGFIDYTATITGVTLWTMYTPWFGLLLLWIFAFKLGWLPLGKFLNPLIWKPYTADYAPGELEQIVFTYIMIVGAGVFLFLLLVNAISRRVHLPRSLSLGLNLGAVALAAAVVWYLLTNTLIGYLAQDILQHMILPAVVLAAVGFGGYMLLMRDSMLEVVKEDFVMAAKAKGLPDRQVRDKHAARNALLPLVTSFVLALAFSVDGNIVIEKIFSWHGLGLTLLEAVEQRDMPLAIGTFTFLGIFALVAHFIADVLYAYLDPRIRYD